MRVESASFERNSIPDAPPDIIKERDSPDVLPHSTKTAGCFLMAGQREEHVAASHTASTWEQASACQRSQGAGLESVRIGSPGFRRFKQLLQEVEQQHEQEINFVREEMEQQLEELRYRVMGGLSSSRHTEFVGAVQPQEPTTQPADPGGIDNESQPKDNIDAARQHQHLGVIAEDQRSGLRTGHGASSHVDRNRDRQVQLDDNMSRNSPTTSSPRRDPSEPLPSSLSTSDGNLGRTSQPIKERIGLPAVQIMPSWGAQTEASEHRPHHTPLSHAKMEHALVIKGFSNQLTELENVKGIKRLFMHWGKAGSDEPDKRWRKFLRTVVHSQLFDGACSAAIIFNAILLGITTDWVARRANPASLPATIKNAERCFTCWFVIEVSLRMLAHGPVAFFFGREWSWNMFDILVVATDVVENLAVLYSSSSDSWSQNLTAMRMPRVLRLVRTIRVLRLVRFFKELRMMVFSVLKSGLLLVWSMTLLMINLYMFGVYLTQNVTFYIFETYQNHGREELGPEKAREIEVLQSHFGNLLKAGHVLFQCITGGINWGEVGRPLEKVHWSNGLVLCFFIFFSVFTVLNIITGIFVDTAIKSAQSDRSEVIQEAVTNEAAVLAHMKQFFEDADIDKSGTITLNELQHQLEHPHMRVALSTLGIEANDATSIFKLLDIDKSGEISVQEFIFGCLEMKGTAKSIDLVTLMHEHRRLKEKLKGFVHIVRELLEKQERSQEKLAKILLSLGPSQIDFSRKTSLTDSIDSMVPMVVRPSQDDIITSESFPQRSASPESGDGRKISKCLTFSMEEASL